MTYYNENDPKAAAWLRELINASLIPDGLVDERSIAEIKPNDLQGFTQCHFFAGIGGWAYALDLAGWPADRPVWTGSCPCQPFSVAGKGLGEADERHLWPVFRELIRAAKPPVVFGEQVASAAGRQWLAGVRSDLEGMGYEVGGADLCAASAGAPHIRQRLYWVADANSERRTREHALLRQEEAGWLAGDLSQTAGSGEVGGVGESDLTGLQGAHRNKESPGRIQQQLANASGGTSGWLADADSGRLQQRDAGERTIPIADENSPSRGLALSSDNGAGSHSGTVSGLQWESVDAGAEGLRQTHGPISSSGTDPRSAGCAGGLGDANDEGSQRRGRTELRERSGELAAWATGAWSDFDLLPCRDGKTRRVESGTFPLVAGLPRGVVRGGDLGLPERDQAPPTLAEAQATAEGRVVRLRGYGNAIVPPLAAEFIGAYLDCDDERSNVLI